MPMPMHSRPMSPAEMHPMNYGLLMSDDLPMNYDLPSNYGPTDHLHRSYALLMY